MICYKKVIFANITSSCSTLPDMTGLRSHPEHRSRAKAPVAFPRFLLEPPSHAARYGKAVKRKTTLPGNMAKELQKPPWPLSALSGNFIPSSSRRIRLCLGTLEASCLRNSRKAPPNNSSSSPRRQGQNRLCQQQRQQRQGTFRKQ